MSNYAQSSLGSRSFMVQPETGIDTSNYVVDYVHQVTGMNGNFKDDHEKRGVDDGNDDRNDDNHDRSGRNPNNGNNNGRGYGYGNGSGGTTIIMIIIMAIILEIMEIMIKIPMHE